MLRSRPTMTSVLASFSAVLAIGSAPSAVAAPEGGPFSPAGGYAIATAAQASRAPHDARVGTAPARNKQGPAAAAASPIVASIDRRDGTRSSACIRPEKFRVDDQGRPWNRPRGC
jgi:hypothetical protein